MSNSVHDGHRERVRAEILDGNYTSKTSPHKVLEALLFYSIPRGDTNEIAHLLIDRFGSFEKVFEADIDTLKTVEGIGEKTAILIKLIGITVKRSFENRHNEIKKFYNMDHLGQMVLEKYYGINKEVVSLISFNAGGQFLGFDFVGDGDIAAVGISLRKIFEIIIKRGATSIVLAHNHPAGTAVPSPADLESTESIGKALGNIGVYLADHIIVDSNDYVSLRQSAQFKYLFE